jgi:hypothetical protein
MKKTLWVAALAVASGLASAQSFSAANTYEFDNGGSGGFYNGSQNWLELDSGGISYVGQDFSVSGLAGTITSVTFSEKTAGAGSSGGDGFVHGNIYLADASFDVVANGPNINVDCPANLALENSDGVDNRFAPIFAGSFAVSSAINGVAGSTFSLTLDLTKPGVTTYLDNVESTNGTLRILFAGDQSFYPTPQANGLSLKIVGTHNNTYADPTVVFQTSPAPEPASMCALGMGIAALISRRRKRA